MTRSAEYLDKRALAQESCLGVRTWERIIARGEIATVRIGNRVLVERSDFAAYMEARKTPAVPAADIRAQLKMIADQALRRRSA